MIKKYTKKLAVIQAIQYNNNKQSINDFLGGEGILIEIGETGNFVLMTSAKRKSFQLNRSDWIIRDEQKSLFTLTDEVFKKRYIQVQPNYYKENVHSLEIIEAVRYTGSESNLTEVYKFCPYLKEIDGLILCHDPRGLGVLFSGYFLTKDKANHFAVFPSEKFKRLFIEYLL